MGGTPLASGTTPPAVTLTGSASGNVAFRMEIQTTGALGASTFRYGAANDGTTSTWIEQNVPTAATYAAIGALAGVTINFPAGTYTNDNVYQGTLSAWTDQVNAKAASQASAGLQPRILIPAINHPAFRFDGGNDVITETTLDLPPPGTTPTYFWGVASVVSWVVTRAMMATGNAGSTMVIGSGGEVTPNWHFSNGAVSPSNGGATVGSYFQLEVGCSNVAGDFFKLGATTVTGILGNSDSAAGINLGAATTGAFQANMDWVVLLIFSGIPTAGERNALTSAAASMYPGILQ